MLFLLLFTALALGAATAVCLPLLRGTGVVTESGAFDRVVYRDQLKEVERDVARGVLSPDEAGSARLEIQRRLLAVDAGAAGRANRSQPRPALALALGALIVAAGAGLYLHFGSPSLPDAPYAGRMAKAARAPEGAPHMDMAQAAQELEAKLQTDPNNAEGWVLLARTESMLGNWHKASDAYGRAIALGRRAPDIYAGYGEMLVLGADGIVSPAAKDAFDQALAIDSRNEVARYYLALADVQAGEDKHAIQRWLSLAADLPADSPMRDSIARGVAAAAHDAGIAAPALPKGLPPQAETQPTPSQQQMSAAAQMPPAQQKAMIKTMVAKLAAHLKSDPNDLDGWLRLGRSYGVLGETDKAVAAFGRAAALKPDDADIKLQEFHAMTANLPGNAKLPPQAVAVLHQVAKLAPEYPEVLWYLGVEAAQSGKPDEARKDWTKLLSQLTPGGEDAKLVKTALDALPK
jgi:cytochrome c-type biogenesis protein CcmH